MTLIGRIFNRLFGSTDKLEETDSKTRASEEKDVKEALPASLRGKAERVGDDFVSEKENPENKQKQQGDGEEKEENRGGAGLIVAGAVGVAGLVAGAIFAPVATAVIGIGGLLAFGLTSCSKDRYAVIQIVNVKPENPANEQLIAMIDNLTKLVQQMLTEMQNQSQQNTQMINYLGTISTNLSNLYNLVLTTGQDMTDKLNEIIRLLTELMNNENLHHEGVMAYFAQLSGQLATMDENQQNNAQAILQYMQQMDANQQERFIQLLEALNNMGANLTVILSSLGSNLENIEELIVQLLAQVNTIQAKLNEINAVISNLNSNMQAGFQAVINAIMQNGATLEEILAMLENIKNLVNQVSNQVQQGNTQNQQLLNQILQAIQGLSTELQAGIAQILAKLDGMDANQQNAFLQMIQHMIDIKAGQGEQNMQMQTIINLIANLDPGSGTPVDLTPILNAIDNLNNNITNQSTALGALLAQILGKLDDIDDKVGTIQTIATNALNVVQHMDGDNHIIIGLLEQIIANQGNYMGNDCLECCENVIILLEQILNAITNGTNDEGFTGDEYNDLLGK